MKKAILYLRFSDIKQLGGTSIEVQEQICRAACLAEGFEVVDVVKNEAVSASKTNTQRVIDLLDFCKKKEGKFEVLLVFKLDRFARSQEQHHWLRSQLLKLGVILRSATEKIDESPSGRLVEGVLAAVNEYDNEVKRERVKQAMWARVEQGLWPWQPPYGYKVNRVEGAKLSPHAIDNTCSESIIDLYTKFSTGIVSMADLSRDFRKRKIRNYKGELLNFSVQNIYVILNNPYYCGLLKHKDGRLINGQHEALVPASLFDKCRAVQENRARSMNTKRMYNNPDFPLRRFVHCSYCGKSLTACWTTSEYGYKHAYYWCHNQECPKRNKMIKKADIENEFMDYLKIVKPTKAFIERFKSRFVKRYEARKQEIKGDYLNQLKEIQALEKDEQRVVEMAKKGILPDHLVKEQIEELEKKITLAKMALTEKHDEELDVSALLTYAENFIQTIEISWFDAPLEIKQRLQRAIFPNGVIYQYPGYSNAEISHVFEIITTLGVPKEEDVPPGRIELPSHP